MDVIDNPIIKEEIDSQIIHGKKSFKNYNKCGNIYMDNLCKFLPSILNFFVKYGIFQGFSLLVKVLILSKFLFLLI